MPKAKKAGLERPRARVQDNLRYPDQGTKRACREAAALAAVPFNRYAIRAILGKRPPSKARLHVINELRQVGVTLREMSPNDPQMRKQLEAMVKQITVAILELRGA